MFWNANLVFNTIGAFQRLTFPAAHKHASGHWTEWEMVPPDIAKENICRTSPKNICRAPPKNVFVRGRYRQFNFEVIFDVQANDPPPSWLCFFSKLCSLSPRPCLVSKSWQTPIGCLLPKERTAAHHSWHFVQRKEVIWIYDLIKEDIKYHWCARIVGNGCIYTLPQKWSADFRDVPSPVCRHFLIFVAPKGLKKYFFVFKILVYILSFTR